MRAERALILLRRTGRALIGAADEVSFLQAVCRVAVETAGYRLAWAGYLADDPDGVVEPVAVAGDNGGFVERLGLRPAGPEGDGGLTRTAIRTGRPAVVRDLASVGNIRAGEAEALPQELRSAIALPLRGQSQILGVFGVYAAESDAFDAAEVEWLEEVAEDLAGGIQALRDRADPGYVRAALEKSEQRYRELVQHTGVVIVRFDPTGVIRFANAFACRCFGYEPNESVGRNIVGTVLPQTDSASGEEVRRRVVREFGEFTDREMPHTRRDGRVVWIRWNNHPICTPSGEVEEFLAVGSEFTEGKRVREALSRERDLAQSYFQIAGVMLLVLDRNGVIWMINKKGCEVLGWSEGEIVGKNWFDHFLPERIREQTRQYARDVYEGRLEFPAYHENPVITRSSEERLIAWHNTVLRAESGAVISTLSSGEDITERRKAEEALRAHANREHEFRRWLASLQEVTNELTLTESPDALYRRAIELGREQLGFDRLSLWLRDPADRDRLVGTYGTAPDGKTVEQHYVRLSIDAFEAFRVIFRKRGSLHLDKEIPLLDDASGREVGEGWHAVAALWDGDKIIGCLRADNLTSGQPVSGNQLELLLLYGSTLGHLSTRKRAEEEVESHARFPTENPNPVLRLDREGVVLFANTAARPLLEEWDCTAGRPVPAFLRELSTLALESGARQVVDIESRNRLYLLNITPIPSAGYVNLYGTDITRRREVLDALRETTETLQAMVKASPLAIVMLAPDGRVQTWNPAAEEMFGWRAERMIGQRLPERFAELYRALDPETQRRTVTGLELTVDNKAGRPVDISLSSAALRDAQGEIRGTVAIIADVTMRHQLEEQLRQAQKMEVVGRLAGGVAHDFNNFLTAILGYCDLATAQLDPNQPLYRHLDEIRKAGLRAGALTRQLLAFSRKQILQLVPLDLNAVIEDMGTMLDRLVGGKVVLVTRLDPAVPAVLADAGQIEQVIVNLAVNARDAMPDGGALTVETGSARIRPAEALRLEIAAGNYVRLSFSDTGMGMTDETRSRIFEPFFTTKEKGKGTGLGLSTVYGILQQSGGGIEVQSAPGQGTTFHLYLPPTDAPPEPNAESPGGRTARRGRETVLVVEDEDMVRELTRNILEEQGYRVLEAMDADEAIRVCREHAEPIPLVITDVIMPGSMGGGDLAGEIARIRPGTRILFISGYTDDAISDHGILAPGTAFLQKPFSPPALIEKVRETLDAEQPGGRGDSPAAGR
jgi:PAS domain S-box-containing protein